MIKIICSILIALFIPLDLWAHSGGDAEIRPAIGRGDFAPLMRWLRANIHGQASIAGTDDILREATGAPLGTTAFKAHLQSRYLDRST